MLSDDVDGRRALPCFYCRPQPDSDVEAVDSNLLPINEALRSYEEAWDKWVDSWLVIRVDDPQVGMMRRERLRRSQRHPLIMSVVARDLQQGNADEVLLLLLLLLLIPAPCFWPSSDVSTYTSGGCKRRSRCARPGRPG